MNLLQFPGHTKDNYGSWWIYMKSLLISHDAREIVEKGVKRVEDEISLVPPQAELQRSGKKD